jgi:PAS domain-containing protein
METTLEILLPLLATLVGVSAGIAALFLLANKRPQPADSTVPAAEEIQPVVLVFSGRLLVDVSETSGHFEKKLTHPRLDDWTAVARNLLPRFPDLPDNPDSLPQGETRVAPAATDDAGELVIRRDGDSTRLILQGDPARRLDGDTLHRMEMARAELRLMRGSLSNTHNPIFARDRDNRMIWANRAYLELAADLGFANNTTEDDPPELFPPLEPVRGGSSVRRDCLTEPGGDIEHWFDICAVDAGPRIMTFTMNVDALVQAEKAQRNFVQTLTKTFAHLSIGLAIFNRDRQLALFNPALVDLTELPVSFLSARPTIRCFFDMLRENQMMPEPKNYSGWRERIGTLVAAASDGNFQETWSLASGQTYRVTGRPHPDGAVAFMFEDISHEISLTRSFRSELALGNAVLDQMDAAMAVFTADGILVFSNAEFREVWGFDPDSSFADTSISDALATWRKKSNSASAWVQVEHALTAAEPLHDTIIDLNDGQRRVCRVRPLITGARMVVFSREAATEATLTA